MMTLGSGENYGGRHDNGDEESKVRLRAWESDFTTDLKNELLKERTRATITA